jgi:hypothetical protein
MNDTAVIKIDGAEVMNVACVSSGLLGENQQSVSVAVENELINLKVEIPTRGLSDSRSLRVNRDMFIGLSIVNTDLSPSGIRFIISREPLPEF